MSLPPPHVYLLAAPSHRNTTMRIRLSQLRRIIKEEVQRTLREGDEAYYTGEVKAIVDKLYDEEGGGTVELRDLEKYFPPEGSVYEIDTDALQDDPKFQEEYDCQPTVGDHVIVSRTDDWEAGAFELPNDPGDTYYSDNKEAVDDAYNQVAWYGDGAPVELSDLVPKYVQGGNVDPPSIAIKKLLADPKFKEEYDVKDRKATRKSEQ